MSPHDSAPGVLRRIAALVPVIFALSCGISERFEQAQTIGVAPRAEGAGAFVEVWSLPLSPPLVEELALSPAPGELLALNNGQILRVDEQGQQLAAFAAPPKSTRIASDPGRRFPHLLVVSSTTKWTGAIDYVETTGYALHAVDLTGREIWKKTFDPKDVSTLEPIVAVLDGAPAIVLGASRRIIRFDQDGSERWNVSLWHHPGTVTSADLSGDGRGGLLVARAPQQEMIVRVGSDGEVLGPWGPGDAPSRLRAVMTDAGIRGISMRQVFGRGPGVRHALSFFDEAGTVIREVVLPPDVGPLSYSPISVMDFDGSGQNRWVIPFNDGTISVFSTSGAELARHATGTRLRAMSALPQREGPDLLVVATHRGLAAWRPTLRADGPGRPLR